ncbi:MAG: hypothetical protein JWR69_191 [Pedosphaera sp.]|nr:hypothetical protein [Pedosphaera sp.]
MKLDCSTPKPQQAGNALLLTIVMTGVALTTLAGVMAWSASSYKQADRYGQYTRSVAAAEAATENVLSQISGDFQAGGESLVVANLRKYRKSALTSTNSSYWADWEFSDAQGHVDGTYVQPAGASSYVVLNSTYAGLKGFVSTYTLISNARQTSVPQDVTGGVFQQIQLARIPIFQFAMYTSGDMEVSCGQPFTIDGRVHSNGQMYVEPAADLTFQSDVTAVGSVLNERHPLDNRLPKVPVGIVVYTKSQQPVSHVPALTLPIGTTNTPTAIREIIQPPLPNEDHNSPIGRQRYYNLADVVVVVNNTTVTASSGDFNGFATVIPTNEVRLFVSTNASFYDARESKTVQSVDINVGALAAWSGTNTNVRTVLGVRDVSSVYVLDRRTQSATKLNAVRAINGSQLPTSGLSSGLTIATARPLYVLGNYNTNNPLPASLVGDAITILSRNWSDTNSTAGVASRVALPTTVNAAILAGAVETTLGVYGGGMENFPRFLETWGPANAFTYNGSMVKMFPSLYATNAWGNNNNIYSPPARVWAYDTRFDDGTKLPPLTPGLVKVIRGQWASLQANQTNPPARF